ncbi:O-antigen ligase domain-containing protein [Candidatus Competibacter phosphatis]|uniref:O-antigen ligase domain-containing protein n=1 Tax=Candidatus Competibacter phosphatis TaxID=221280 RepID=A0ABX1TJ28_9GAMM|nr:O-antigen ligase family protein [Candidatus Competibacter phosphatis]NMQ19393.1 O-antigen ligase domain-containing protein [Candidatus Competibacter phosphatis]
MMPCGRLFFRQGWLLLAVLPLTQIGGRALFNLVAGLYVVWGLLSLWGRRDRLDRSTTLLYLALLGVALAGVPGSVDPVSGFRVWIQFAAQTSTLLLVQAALRESPENIDRLLAAMALFGGIALASLYLLLPYHWFEWSGRPFNPLTQLQEDNLPFLLPFLLGWIWRYGDRRWRYGAMLGVTAAALGYVAISEGRAALFGLIVGLAGFCWAVLAWRPRWVALLAVGVLLAGIAANIGPFLKAELDLEHPLDAFTAGRTIVWRHALEHPPARPWLGVGIANASHSQELLRFELSGTQVQIKHFHNFLIDAWYETGILGVGLLLTLAGTVFVRLAWVWRRLPVDDRQRAGILLAAALSIIAAALLSFSYTSRQFACYLFACLGGLIHFDRSRAGAASPANADTDPDKR